MKRFIAAAAGVHIGKKRKNNEDNLYFNGVFLTEETRENPAEFETVCDGGLQIYAVCDGMGGEQMGELASLTAAQTIHKYSVLLKNPPKKNTDAELERCICEANNVIFEVQRKRGIKRIGTTLALLAAENKSAYLCNIGDSRIYLMRNGRLEQLSVDHTAAANLVKLGALTPEQAKTHPHRNQLTQYVGIDPEEMVIQAHKNRLKMKNGDIFLLCSDGLTDMIDDAQISHILKDNLCPADKVRRLITSALSEGRDNITAIVLEYTYSMW